MWLARMGYCQFDTIDAAVRAKEAMHRTVYEGRTVSVRFAAHDVIGRRQTNPPSKTIYVGNMPFQMTDRDINDLFKDVPNVIDVRVSMDRRTGQFKGFVHAEFVDIESAKFGFGLLRGRTPHGRELKIDYSLQDRRASPIRQVVSDSP